MTPDTEQDSKFLLNSKPSAQLQEFPVEEEVEPSAPPQKGLNLRPYLRTAKRRAWLIAGFTAITTAAALYSSSKALPIYGGNFQLLVEPATSEQRMADPLALTRSRGGVPDAGAFELDYSTVFTILTSSRMLSSIVDQIQAEYPQFNVGQLRSGLQVERLKSTQFGPGRDAETKIVQISYQGLDPELVELVLEQTAKRYLKYSLEERKTNIGQAVEFIEEQLPSLQERVKTLRAQQQKLQQQYNLIDPTSQGSELFAQVRQLANEQIAVQRELQEQKTLYTHLQEQLRLNPDDALAASALSQNPGYQQLLAQLKEVESQIAVESARFQPDSPQIQSLQEKRQNLQNLLDREIQQIVGQNSTNTASNPQVLAFQDSTRQGLIGQLVETANQIQVLEVRNQALLQTKNTFEQQAQKFPAIISEYTQLQGELDLATQTLNQLLSQRETLRVEAAQTTVPWELVSEPQIVRDGSGNPLPQVAESKKKLIMAVAAGLVLGMGTAVFYEKLRNIFYSVEDIEDATRLPLLGTIPQERSIEPSSKFRLLSPTFSSLAESGEEIEGSEQSSFLFWEAFDSLYTNIRFISCDRPVRSIAVCSATPGDGKSVVALHLAQTAAATGQRVLLVDANLRSPKLHRRLDTPNFKGLSDLLDTQLEPKDLIEQLPLADNLFVLTSGQPLPKSTKRLASDRMDYLKEKFQRLFDLVIYDTPNLLDYPDASFLAANTDGILLVVTVGDTKQSSVMKAIDRLNNFGLPLLGLIVNRVKAR
ncbi:MULTISPECIES: GumC family protein [unclassified Coleofasciculus]|uniref:GumC family protein n=1 Tax=unclassified Coleofasciculus TaxID=2692782 RepID=UPI00187F8212|nr:MULTISPECIES: tyrosine-protein kinase domain-containing protein [unclassified Coleofasciculus]MBE9125765.1 polysaccharide biosynthesis tyrosine autokinase [Coleofasciculus sp. LEGE 07081]MBE9148438.1 polysaccharide biosynthesis tyrosine autokinase [Coleofasciculus sp. LEGE 07092]